MNYPVGIFCGGIVSYGTFGMAFQMPDLTEKAPKGKKRRRMSVPKTSGAGQPQSGDISSHPHHGTPLETEVAPTGKGAPAGLGSTRQSHSRTSQYRGVTRHRRSGR